MLRERRGGRLRVRESKQTRYVHMASKQQKELALELATDDAALVVNSDLLPADHTTVRLRSVYFDTPAQDLMAAGFLVSIRETEGQHIQTVTASGTASAGVYPQPEWQCDVEGETPVLDATTPISALLGKKVRDIAPVFAIEVERRIWNLTWDDATIEVALDCGYIVAGDRCAPLCEIELGLKSGPPAALFSLARKLDTVAALRPAMLTRPDRGFRLLGPATCAVKAEPVPLSPDASAIAAFGHIASACLRQFRLNAALMDRSNPEALHQARVALRRLRSAFSIFKPVVEDGAFERLRADIRWLADVLGEVRDLDTLKARCDREEIGARLGLARDQAWTQAEAALASPRARALMLDLTEWLSPGDWLTRSSDTEVSRMLVRDFAASALDRLRRKVRKGGKELADVDDQARLQVRKDARKLRDATAFFAPLFHQKRQQRRTRRFLAALETLQDPLRALNDLATAHTLFSRIGVDDRQAAELLDNGGDRLALIERADDAHDAFMDAKRFWR